MNKKHTIRRLKKVRLKLSFSRSAVLAGKRLAKLENRSFSKTLEVLIERAIRNSSLTIATENKLLAA
jgi:hypothetical protein